MKKVSLKGEIGRGIDSKKKPQSFTFILLPVKSKKKEISEQYSEEPIKGWMSQ